MLIKKIILFIVTLMILMSCLIIPQKVQAVELIPNFVQHVGWWMYGKNNGVEESEPIAIALQNGVKNAVNNTIYAPVILWGMMKAYLEGRSGAEYRATNEADALTLEREFKTEYEGKIDVNPFPDSWNGETNRNVSIGSSILIGTASRGIRGVAGNKYEVFIYGGNRTTKYYFNGNPTNHIYVFEEEVSEIFDEAFVNSIRYTVVAQDGQVLMWNAVNNGFDLQVFMESSRYRVRLSGGKYPVAKEIAVVLGSEWVERDYGVVIEPDSPVRNPDAPWTYNGINFADILNGQFKTVDEMLHAMQTNAAIQQAILERLESYDPTKTYTGTAPVANPITGELEYPSVPAVIDNTWGVGKILERIWTGVQAIPGAIATIPQAITNAVDTTMDVPMESINFDNLKLDGIITKFPFSIPFDFIHVISMMAVPASPPDLTINLDTAFMKVNHTIDIQPYSPYITFFKFFVVVTFIITLMMVTGRVIKW